MDNTQEATNLLEEEAIPYRVMQLPPNNLPTDIQHETIFYNRQILKKYGNKTIKTNDLYERTNMVDNDKFHLTNSGQEEMARLVGTEIKKGIKRKQDNVNTKPKTNDATRTHNDNRNQTQASDDHTTFTIYLEEEIVGRVIGKEGSNIRKVRDNHQVGIGTKKEEDGGAKLTITGQRQSVNKAQDEMDDIIETARKNAQRSHSREDRRKTQTCWNFKKGNCPYGARCWYAHTSNPLDISTRTTPERPSKRPRNDTSPRRKPSNQTENKENTKPNNNQGEHHYRSRSRNSQR